jgi:hypothetical protein
MTVWRSLPLAALMGFGTVASSARMDPNGTVIGRIACNVVNGKGMHERPGDASMIDSKSRNF